MKQNLIFFALLSEAFFFTGMWFETYRSERNFRESLYITCVEKLLTDLMTAAVLEDKSQLFIPRCRRFVEESIKAMKEEPLPPGVRPLLPGEK